MRQEISIGKIPLLISDFENFNRQEVTNLCLSLEKPNTIESNISPQAKYNLWESDFNFLEKHQELTSLKLWILRESQTAINKLNNTNYNIAIIESWAHVTRNGGYHRPHHHNNSTWSGIFYVDCETNKGGNNNWYLPYYLERKSGLEFADDRFTANFVPGRMVLFPSMLLHDAEPYHGSKPKIVIAFNIICL